MAVPTTPEEWLVYLSRRHQAEVGELEMLDRYYEGTQPLTYMHPEVLKEVQDRIRPVIIGWPQLIVDAVEERLDVEGFRLPDEDSADDEIWRVWQANDMDVQTQQGHVDALAMRRSYVCVGSNEDDAGTPIVTVESPLEVFADVDPRTRKVRAALRLIHDQDTVAQVNERYATLYLPDETIWYRWDGNWAEEDRDQHGLGRVPVVPVVNRPRLHTARRDRSGRSIRYGSSEFGPVIPISDAACKIASDMMVAADFAAIPFRGFWGLTKDDLKDQDGNVVTAMQAIFGRFMTLANDEGREFQFPAADLSNFHNTLDSLARIASALGAIPASYMGLAADDAASADAIRSRESRLVKRCERKTRNFGGSYEEVGRLIRRFQDGDWDPRYLRLESIWRDCATPTVAQAADATVKKYQADIITLRQAREDLDYTDAQIRRMEADDEKAAQRDPLAVIARNLPADAVPAAEPAPTVTAPAGELEPAGAGA